MHVCACSVAIVVAISDTPKDAAAFFAAQSPRKFTVQVLRVKNMPLLRMLRKRFHRSSAHLYPSRRDAEPISVKRMEKILRERNIVSKHFHVKVCLKCMLYSCNYIQCYCWGHEIPCQLECELD